MRAIVLAFSKLSLWLIGLGIVGIKQAWDFSSSKSYCFTYAIVVKITVIPKQVCSTQKLLVFLIFIFYVSSKIFFNTCDTLDFINFFSIMIYHSLMDTSLDKLWEIVKGQESLVLQSMLQRDRHDLALNNNLFFNASKITSQHFIVCRLEGNALLQKATLWTELMSSFYFPARILMLVKIQIFFFVNVTYRTCQWNYLRSQWEIHDRAIHKAKK